LQLILKTIQANFTDDTTLIIQGVKEKTNNKNEITDDNTIADLEKLIQSFKELK